MYSGIRKSKTIVVLVTTGNIDKTLPLPISNINDGLVFDIKKIDTGTGSVIVTVEASGSIDGVSSYTISNQYEEYKFVKSGNNYNLLSSSINTQQFMQSIQDLVWSETPVGNIDGNNKTYTTTKQFIDGTEDVIVNNALLIKDLDYTLSGTTLVLTNALAAGTLLRIKGLISEYTQVLIGNNPVDTVQMKTLIQDAQMEETPTGTLDGLNNTFTISAALIPKTETILVNGIVQISGTDYNLVGTTLTMISIPHAGDSFIIKGFKA